MSRHLSLASRLPGLCLSTVASDRFERDRDHLQLAWRNVRVDTQAVAHAHGYNARELSTSNGIDWIIGNY